MHLETDLWGAVDRGELVAWFQPQFDLASDSIVGVEGLCRWQHAELGLVMPADFIALSEEVGLIHDIGSFMIDEGIRFAERCRQLGARIEVAINVSPTQLSTGFFFDRLVGALERQPLPDGCLTIEITESLAINNVSEVARHLSELRELGVGISIDDFGTGFSSIAQVLSLPATELKIDRSLIGTYSPATSVLLAAIVDLAHERGMRVVAEGVETLEQLDAVRELDCDRAQGYFLARPASQSDTEALIFGHTAGA